jgi:secreted trypsin-like serine protease
VLADLVSAHRLAVVLATSGLIGASISACPAAAAVPSIIGGSPAASGTWPSIALVVDSMPRVGVERCSGTVIAPNLVLTAAHCAVDLATRKPWPVAGFTITTGSLDSSRAVSQVSGVIRSVIWPEFKPQTTDGGITGDGDAALLELGVPTTAPATALASDPSDSDLYAGGTAAAIAGWGLTNAFAADPPRRLHWATTVVQDPSSCAEQAGSMLAAAFDAVDQTCVLDVPSDSTATCAGDSGGPLVATDAAGRLVQIGITSWGGDLCSTYQPDFFERTDVLSPWIQHWIARLATPASATGAATAVTETSAVLNGSVNPNGADTTYLFQWGRTQVYRTDTASRAAGNVTTSVPVSSAISGLKPGATYHFRLVSTSAKGTTFGADQTLTTPPA